MLSYENIKFEPNLEFLSNPELVQYKIFSNSHNVYIHPETIQVKKRLVVCALSRFDYYESAILSLPKPYQIYQKIHILKEIPNDFVIVSPKMFPLLMAIHNYWDLIVIDLPENIHLSDSCDFFFGNLVFYTQCDKERILLSYKYSYPFSELLI